jgi:dimethylamine/trimethylamine dehydrogenase
VQTAGARTITSTQVHDVSDGRVDLRGGPLAMTSTTVDVDAVVWVTQRVSDDALYRDLVAEPALLESNGIERVVHVGDCRAPRMHVADTIFDAHRLGREFDFPTPEVAAPYIREHRVLGWQDTDYDAILTATPHPIQP